MPQQPAPIPNNQAATAQQRATVAAAGAQIPAGTTSRYVAIDPNTGQIVGNVGNTLPKTGENFTVTPMNQGGSSSTSSGSSSKPREVECPFCKGEVLPKQAGRPFAAISGWLQRSFKIRLPTGLLALLQDIMPVAKTTIRKKPDTCKACEGKLIIPDPSDDSAKWEQVKANAQAASKKIAELESRWLAPACGNRHTILQGNDLLEVGLGFNDAPSYRVDKDKNIRASGLLDPGETNPEKGPPIPKGAKANHVQGIDSMASPGGHYFIKCANKFTVMAGAQGIELNTGGPLTINAGIIRFSGPELTFGTKTGRLTLEGEVVNLEGKSIEVAPSDGHFFVRGTMSNTGNYICQGHAHIESSTVVKMSTTGRNEPSKPSAPSDLYDGPAFWGGLNGEGITSSLKDIKGLATTRIANPLEAQQMVTPRFFEDVRDKMMTLAYNLRPWELKPTGVLIPGTAVAFTGSSPCNYGGSAAGAITGTVTTLIPVYNFPHHHGVPNLSHNHETRIPDIDCSSENAGQVRSIAGGSGAAAPLHQKTGDSQGIVTSIFSAIAAVFVPVWKNIQGPSGPFAK